MPMTFSCLEPRLVPEDITEDAGWGTGLPDGNESCRPGALTGLPGVVDRKGVSADHIFSL